MGLLRKHKLQHHQNLNFFQITNYELKIIVNLFKEKNVYYVTMALNLISIWSLFFLHQLRSLSLQ